MHSTPVEQRPYPCNKGPHPAAYPETVLGGVGGAIQSALLLLLLLALSRFDDDGFLSCDRSLNPYGRGKKVPYSETLMIQSGLGPAFLEDRYSLNAAIF